MCKSSMRYFPFFFAQHLQDIVLSQLTVHFEGSIGTVASGYHPGHSGPLSGPGLFPLSASLSFFRWPPTHEPSALSLLQTS